MRRRLTLTIVGLVTGALLLAGGGALLVASWTARQHAAAQLLTQDEALARSASAVRSPVTLRVVGRVLRLDRAAIVVVDTAGRVVAAMPRGAGAVRLPAPAGTEGPRSGLVGNIAYAVAPVRLDASVTGPLPRGDTTAVLLTRRVGALFPHWGFFVVVGAATVVVAAGVAMALGRRIARPLLAASEVTERIAAGDLEARLPTTDGRRDELDSLARSINAMAGSLARARRRETELLASVSHDLRTPLTSIRGYAEAIADGVTDDPRRAAGIIGDQARRLEHLVGDLLDLAKVRAHQLRLHPSPVDLAASTEQAIDAVVPQARRLGVSVSRRPPGDGVAASAVSAASVGADAYAYAYVYVYADADRLAQVLTNLLQNAVVHATSAVALRLGLPAAGEAGTVWLTVEDDGPGIPGGELERVFDRFYQIDRGPAARVGGSGLGLSIVAELVSAMGGTVRAESPISPDPARPGTRFVLALPAARPVPHGSAPARDREPVRPATSDG